MSASCKARLAKSAHALAFLAPVPLYFYDKYASLGHDGDTAQDTGVCRAFMPGTIKATPGKSEVLVRDLL